MSLVTTSVLDGKGCMHACSGVFAGVDSCAKVVGALLGLSLHAEAAEESRGGRLEGFLEVAARGTYW